MLTEGGSKMLRFMLEEAVGCDAWLSEDQFVVQYGWHLAHHKYYRDVGVEALAWFRRHLPASHGMIPAGAFPMIGRFPSWQFGARAVWIAEEPQRIAIQVRDGALDLPPGRPAPIEPPPVFVAGVHPCPHCGAIPERYRVLRGGAQVCLACGTSSPPR